MLPDEKSHVLSIQRKILQHKIEIPTILGSGAPSLRKRFFNQKVLHVPPSYDTTPRPRYILVADSRRPTPLQLVIYVSPIFPTKFSTNAY